MIRTMIRTVLTALICWASANGQSPDIRPAFEVASVKPAAPRGGVRMDHDPARIQYLNVNLKSVLMSAFGVKQYQIDGPEWLGSEKYDIVAKAPDGAAKEQVPLMLQRLLAERFKLVVRHETRDMLVYAMVAAKGGPRLEHAQSDGGSATPAAGAPAQGTIRAKGAGLEARDLSLFDLAGALSGFMDRPVIDQTGVKGAFSFVLEFPLMDPTGTKIEDAQAVVPRPTVFTALERLGLELKSARAPIDILVVEHAERVPTEN